MRDTFGFLCSPRRFPFSGKGVRGCIECVMGFRMVYGVRAAGKRVMVYEWCEVVDFRVLLRCLGFALDKI